jgi:Flp pilus assembly protein TadG
VGKEEAMRSQHCLRGFGFSNRRRHGLSAILIVVVITVMIVFVAMAVDYGRMRVTKVQLQNAADAGATAAASGLEFLPDGVIETQDRASDAAAENFSLDQSDGGTGTRADALVNLVVDEDVEFGIWRDNPLAGQEQWTPLASSGGGVDERREANAVRVYARRTTEFVDSDGNTITRNTPLPLIFGPVFGQATGNVQADATAAINGGRTGAGFVGLDWVKLNGTTRTDSYDSENETYPGVDGPNKLGSIASNGDIELVGSATVWGDAHPGVNGSITPYPLGGNVDVTGYMNPLPAPLVYAMPPFTPPDASQLYPTGPGQIQPSNAYNKGNNSFAPKNGSATIHEGKYLFSSWTSGPQDVVELKNDIGPIEIWVDGDVTCLAQAGVKILSDAFPVTFHVNGDFKMDGGGIFNAATTGGYVAKPSSLIINVCKANTNVSIGGSPTMSAHINAPGSDVKVNGNANGDFGYFGTIVGKTLFVTGGSELHYDETGNDEPLPFTVRLVD